MWAQADWQRWVFGFGPGSFSTHSHEWTQGSAVSSLIFQHGHSDAIQGLLEYGICGILAWSLLALAPLVLARGSRVNHKEADVKVTELLPPMQVLFSIGSMFIYVMQMPFFGFIFWLLVFTFLRQQAGPVVAATPSVQRRVGARVILFGMIVVFGSEAVARPVLEQEMREFIKRDEPSLDKEERQVLLRQYLQVIPAPMLYPVDVEGYQPRE